MRIRHKPWARPELEKSDFFVAEPAAFRGRWNEVFGNGRPLRVELGCGKGGFLAEMAARHPDVNFLAIDLKSEMLVLAKRKIEARDPDPVSHVRIFSQDIERIDAVLAPEDRVERIYLNFCPPWARERDKKHRLTFPKHLNKYRAFLAPGGEIWFKTDDGPFFEDSLRYFEEAGFTVRFLTRDLAASGFSESVPTEHEEMFAREGKTTKFLIAVRPPEETA